MPAVRKSALTRTTCVQKLLPPIEEDPLWEIYGMVKGGGKDSLSVDDVVYGPKRTT
jgi:hypothetical protein